MSLLEFNFLARGTHTVYYSFCVARAPNQKHTIMLAYVSEVHIEKHTVCERTSEKVNEWKRYEFDASAAAAVRTS